MVTSVTEPQLLRVKELDPLRLGKQKGDAADAALFDGGREGYRCRERNRSSHLDFRDNGRLSTVNTVRRDGAIVDSNGATAGTPPESTTYHYDLLGRMDYTEMPNSVVEDYTFDNMDRLDVIRHYASDGNNANLTDNVLKDIFDYS